MEYLVSIIIPVYNLEEYIEECIESVVNQSYDNIEIILVNDGSTDDSLFKCQEYAQNDSRIIIIDQPNKGVVSARCAGINCAQGEFVLFVDGDDYISKDLVKDAVKGIKDADLFSFGVSWETRKGITRIVHDDYEPKLYKGTDLAQIYDRMLYDRKNNFLHPMTSWLVNKLYRTELLKQLYETIDERIRYAEDSVLLFKYMLKCKQIVISHEHYYFYRYRNDSAAHKISNTRLIDINLVYNNLYDTFIDHPQSDSLIFQLQKWVVIRTSVAINEQMGFNRNVYIPQFVIDVSDLRNKKIVLYGAGRVGQDAKKQLFKFGMNVVLWVDKAFDNYKKIGLDVSSIETIINTDFDTIFIAIENENVANIIKAELIEFGVSAERILWRSPARLF